MVMAEEFFALFVPDAVVDQNSAVSVHHQQTAHGHIDHVVFVGRVMFAPQRFGDNAKHGAAVKLEISGRDSEKLHKLNNLAD
jgi:hypothetical protein